MKPPKGAGERVYPHGRMWTGTDPKPTASEIEALPSPVRAVDDLDDDARWQAEEDAGPTSREVDERIASKLLARETSAPRVVEPDVLVMPIPADAGSGAEYRGKLEPPRAIPKVFSVRRLGHATRIVEPDSIDSTDLAARDRPSAAEAHAADLTEQLERANASIVTMARSLSRVEAERREWAAKLAEAQRPRQHRLVSSLLTLLRGDR